MKKLLRLTTFNTLCLLMLGSAAQGQLAFKNANNKLNTTNFNSGCPTTIVDWNNDGMDDIIRLDQGRYCYIEIQRTNNTFRTQYMGDFGSGSQWAMCAADLDHNGYMDILAGGSSPSIQIFMTNNAGTGMTLQTLPNSGFFLQNATFADINNDGWVDAFLCDDNAESHVYLNNGAGILTESSIINFDVTGTDDSGNYGSVWTDFDNDGDFDLYIAKCRQGVNSPTDGRRINVMFVNNGNGTFTENAAAHGLAIGWQSWTSAFGDLDNDGDQDVVITNHDYQSQILENDGAGNFTDITNATNFDIDDITPIQSVVEDFDNDGFMDIFVTGSDDRFYRNNGNMTFTKVDNLFDGNDMESFSIGDLNHDGFVDIYGSYATIYTNPSNIDDVVWMNGGNTNKFLTVQLKGTVSNHQAIGAKVRIYGAFGQQVREVKCGESYGTVNSSMLHFGLGTNVMVDSVVIEWPSGIEQTLTNISTNQFLTVIESDCVAPAAIMSTLGGLVICNGTTTTLQAPAGYNYLWSNGATTQSVVIGTTGEFNFVLSQSGNNCTSVSPTVSIALNPDETPSITAASEIEFCDGGSVTLLGPAGLSSYQWSNGDVNQNTVITSSGNYTLTINGSCQQWTSNAITVNVVTATAPTAADVNIPAPGSASLNAVGNNISWFATNTGGTPIATGNNFNTPVLNANTTYYVQSAATIGGGLFITGETNHTGTSNYSSNGSTNATTTFEVLSNCTLKTVKTYTDTYGTRKIDIYDDQGALYASRSVDITQDTQVVNLNLFLIPGVYTIGTDAAINQQIIGWAQDGPRLKRTINNGGLPYPYVINNLISINDNSFGTNYFYYFYDWKVEQPTTYCTSALVPVNVFVGPQSVLNLTDGTQVSLYPNPTSAQLNLVVSEAIQVKMFDQTGRVVLNQTVLAGVQTLNVSNIAPGIYTLHSAGTHINDKQIVVIQ
jgi:hypothetical protein